MVKNRLVLAFVGICSVHVSAVFASQAGMPKYGDFDQYIDQRCQFFTSLDKEVAAALFGYDHQQRQQNLDSPTACPVPSPKKKGDDESMSPVEGCPAPDPKPKRP